MTIEEENAALRTEVERLTKLCAYLRQECSVGFRYGQIRSSHDKTATTGEPKRSLLEL